MLISTPQTPTKMWPKIGLQTGLKHTHTCTPGTRPTITQPAAQRALGRQNPRPAVELTRSEALHGETVPTESQFGPYDPATTGAPLPWNSGTEGCCARGRVHPTVPPWTVINLTHLNASQSLATCPALCHGCTICRAICRAGALLIQRGVY